MAEAGRVEDRTTMADHFISFTRVVIKGIAHTSHRFTVRLEDIVEVGVGTCNPKALYNDPDPTFATIRLRGESERTQVNVSYTQALKMWQDALEEAKPKPPKPSLAELYDPTYGDNRDCECGHSYERHFDSHDDMSPVGCKYCGWKCGGFTPAKEDK